MWSSCAVHILNHGLMSCPYYKGQALVTGTADTRSFRVHSTASDHWHSKATSPSLCAPTLAESKNNKMGGGALLMIYAACEKKIAGKINSHMLRS